MLNFLLYRIGQFIALNTPLKIGYAIAVFVADIQYFFAFRDKNTVKKNLKVIFPDKTDKEIKDISRRMFENFGKYLVDFFRFSKLDQGYIKKNIKIENIDYFNQALSKGKGVIVLTAHLGNWELGGVVVALLGYPFWVVALPHKNKKVDEFFNNQRQSKGIHVIPFGKAARQCLSLLRENKMIALVGDRDFSEKGLVLDFFGKKTHFPLGPAAFAIKTGAVIVPGFMFRNSDDSFTLRIEEPIEFKPKADIIGPQEITDKDMNNVIGQYINIFERYIKERPDQWYMFRRFWIE